MHGPFRLVHGTERILIVVEAHFGIDHQTLPTRHPQSDVGAYATTFLVGAANFRLEVAMLGKSAALQHIPQLLLAPAATRLGRVAKGIDQLGSFRRDSLRAALH